jgi:hypothetical protein
LYRAWTLLNSASPATAAVRAGFCRDYEERALDKLDTTLVEEFPKEPVPAASRPVMAGKIIIFS